MGSFFDGDEKEAEKKVQENSKGMESFEEDEEVKERINFQGNFGRGFSDHTAKRNSRRKELIALGVTAVALLVFIVIVGVNVFLSHQTVQKSQELQEQAEIQLQKLEEAKAKNQAEDQAQAEAEAQAQAEAEAQAQAEAEAQAQAEAEAQAQAEAEAQAQIDDGSGTTIKLCMVGDVLISSAINDSCNTGSGYDFNCLFQNVSSQLQEYDIRIVNQETTCGGEEYEISGYPSFNSPHQVQDAIANAGFNVVCMATNHTLDKGRDPLNSCLNYWHTNYPQITTIGAYDSQEASDNIYVYTKDNFSVAVLNYTYGSNAGSGEYYGADWSLNLLEADQVYADIQAARSMADYVVVCPHWGTEYQSAPDEFQTQWMQYFADWGVDLVIGTHPHCLEPLESYTNCDGNQMIVYYSIGNFVSNQDYAYSLVGAIADVTIRKDNNGNVHVDDFGAIPIVTQKASTYTTYLLRDYSQELADCSNNAGEYAPEFSYQYCVDLVNNMFGDRLRKASY